MYEKSQIEKIQDSINRASTWELVSRTYKGDKASDTVERMQVSGGYIYKNVSEIDINGSVVLNQSICFVPVSKKFSKLKK